ncbi:MAG: putative metal-dependent hydrolase [Porticoccaceae bacterium]
MTQLSFELEKPIDYKLIVSPRARRLTLRVEPGRGVIVTAPKRFPKRDIPKFVESNRRWIENSLIEVERLTPAIYQQWPPRRLDIQALSEVWHLVFSSDIPTEACISTKVENKQTVCLRAETSDKCAVVAEISERLMTTARAVLPPMLAELAARHGLNYSKVQVRGQRSVWGSYSSTGTLSLNYKLLFLPPELVDYVLLHELAHTLYLDHSPKFWQQLEQFHPDARALDKRLKKAGRDVPPWLELER